MIKFYIINAKNPYTEEEIEKLKNELATKYNIIDDLISSEISEFKITDEHYVYKIKINIQTYDVINKLKVELSYKGTDLLSNNFLEKLKIQIKNNLLSLFSESRCIWLEDAQSEELSKHLYAEINKVENLLRNFIIECMIHSFGLFWWEKIAPDKIETSFHQKKTEVYKKTFKDFANIDTHLMSLNTEHLSTILELEIKKIHNPTVTPELERYLRMKDKDKFFSEMQKQLKIEKNMWNDVFSRYLEKEFLGYWHNLCENRNHIAHNKLIDIKNYKKALGNIENINKGIESAKQKFEKLNMSNEMIEEIEKDIDEEKEFLDSLIESEAGVRIRNDYEIEELFLESISEFKDNIVAIFDYNTDIIIKNTDIDFNTTTNLIILEIHSSFLKEVAIKIEILYTTFCDAEGSDSEVVFRVYFITDIEQKQEDCSMVYTNGKAVFNSEGGYYMPETQDKMNISELEDVEKKIRNFSEENLSSKEDFIERYQEDGYFYNEIYCTSCGEETIISEDELQFEKNLCISCMTKNSIVECSRCSNPTNEKVKEDVNFCESCNDFMFNKD